MEVIDDACTIASYFYIILKYTPTRERAGAKKVGGVARAPKRTTVDEILDDGREPHHHLRDLVVISTNVDAAVLAAAGEVDTILLLQLGLHGLHGCEIHHIMRADHEEQRFLAGRDVRIDQRQAVRTTANCPIDLGARSAQGVWCCRNCNGETHDTNSFRSWSIWDAHPGQPESRQEGTTKTSLALVMV